jgi:hypothetical protein
MHNAINAAQCISSAALHLLIVKGRRSKMLQVRSHVNLLARGIITVHPWHCCAVLCLRKATQRKSKAAAVCTPVSPVASSLHNPETFLLQYKLAEIAIIG